MYELLKQYEKIGSRKVTTEKLRELLMLEEDEYSQFSDFRKRVLKTAQNELSEKTDIAFTWEEEREKQKCVAISFSIKSQTRPQAKNRIEKPINDPEISAPVITAPTPVNQGIEQLVDFGVTRTTAETLVKEYGEERIQAAIVYARSQQKGGKLNNPAGFVIGAIKNGYRDNQAEERQRKEAAARAQANKEARRKEWERMKTRWNEWKAEQVQAYIAAMDTEVLEREKTAFHESVKGTIMAKAVFSTPESEARFFRIHMAGQVPGLGVPDWAQGAGIDLSPFLEFAKGEGKL
jgi:hypothetical protein